MCACTLEEIAEMARELANGIGCCPAHDADAKWLADSIDELKNRVSSRDNIAAVLCWYHAALTGTEIDSRIHWLMIADKYVEHRKKGGIQ